MTEGPESTFLANYIRKHFINKKLKNVIIKAGRYKNHGPPPNYSKFKLQLPLKLNQIYKKGKVLFLFFEKDWCLIVKFGMTGWFFRKQDEPEIIRGYNIEFEFDNDNLYYSDFRNFGTLTFTNNASVVLEEINRLAPDILNENINFKQVYERIQGLNKGKADLSIEDALMDQTLILSGIGNIIKSEVLYDAKLSPTLKLKDLTKDEWKKIFYSSKKISNKVLDYLQDSGLDLEKYESLRKVYNKDVDPYGNKIYSRISKSGRRTFWVPEIQN